MEIEALSVNVYLSRLEKEGTFSKIRLECRILDYGDRRRDILCDYDYTPKLLTQVIQNSLNAMFFPKPVGEFVFHNEGLHIDDLRLPEKIYRKTIRCLIKRQNDPEIFRIVSKITPQIYSE